MLTKIVGLSTAQLISYTSSSLSFSEAKARFEASINRPASESTKVLFRVLKATTASEVIQSVDKVTRGGDFVFFIELDHQGWLKALTGDLNIPSTVAYIFGNPIIARHIFERDINAALFIPPRILLREAAQGVTLSYHLPSSLLPDPGNSDRVLKTALLDLDKKIERLVLDVLLEGPRL